MAEAFVQVAPDSTGAKLHTRSKTVGANTVHEQVVTVGSQRTRTGLYRSHAGPFTLTVGADTLPAGRWWLINPVGSGVAMGVKKISFASQHNTALATPTGPRILISRFSFTGTASGTALAVAKRVRTAVAGLAADATPVGVVRTANTGMTITAGEAIKAFFPVVALTAVGGVAAGTDEWDPDNEDMELILAAGEGVVCHQADAGTTADTRRWVNNITWEEFTAP